MTTRLSEKKNRRSETDALKAAIKWSDADGGAQHTIEPCLHLWKPEQSGVVWCGVVWCGVVWCAEGAVTKRQKAGMSTHG